MSTESRELPELVAKWRADERNYADPAADVVIAAKHACADELEAALAHSRAQDSAASVNPWQAAVDDGRIVAHLGVADDGVSKEEAVRQLGELIDWHIAVATDPAVNGGFKLVPVADAQDSGGEASIGAAFLRVLGDPTCKWRETGAKPFIDRVAREAGTAAEQPAKVQGNARVGRIRAALAVIQQDYGNECEPMATRREYVEDAVSQLIDAGYTPQPAAPSAQAVLALADKWDRIADTHGVRTFTGNDHRLFANELRAVVTTQPAGAAVEAVLSEAFDAAMKASWEMVVASPTWAKGSYFEGHNNGAIAALQTVRENYDKECARLAKPQQRSEQEPEPQTCRDDSGCPTEGAVLRREWHEMKAQLDRSEQEAAVLREVARSMRTRYAAPTGDGPSGDTVSSHAADVAHMLAKWADRIDSALAPSEQVAGGGGVDALLKRWRSGRLDINLPTNITEAADELEAALSTRDDGARQCEEDDNG